MRGSIRPTRRSPKSIGSTYQPHRRLAGGMKSSHTYSKPKSDPRMSRSQTIGSNGGRNATEGAGSGGRLEQPDLLLEEEALSTDALHLDRNELAVGDQLLAQRGSPGIPRKPRIRLGGAETAEDARASSSDAEQAVGAVAREEPVAELLHERDVTREEVSRKEPLEEVVIAAVAVTVREPELPVSE